MLISKKLAYSWVSTSPLAQLHNFLFSQIHSLNHTELNKMRKLSEELNDNIRQLENKTEIETLVRSKIQLIEEINEFEQHQKGVIQELETAYITSLNSANQAELRKREFDEAKSVLSQQYKVQRLALYRGECPADTFKMLQEFATSLDQNPEASRQMREEVERVSLDPEEYDKNAVMILHKYLTPQFR